ncbi:MAG: riboflavin synthase [candidate division WOR-3 bacterium]|nr:MAG: riboflavin synthase [candidate division WOR-3 bacterium]
MFTGIIEEKAKIYKIVRGRVQRIYVHSGLQINKGDSIAIQGICLTVTNVEKQGFSVEAMVQTGEVTTLSQWRVGDYVNLERPLRIGDRLGGHILLGHTDETGTLLRKRGNQYVFKISPRNSKYLIPKGSIGIDGVSLTIGTLSKNTFSVYLIPYTLSNTTFGSLKVGAAVNIEYDYLAKILFEQAKRH